MRNQRIDTLQPGLCKQLTKIKEEVEEDGDKSVNSDDDTNQVMKNQLDQIAEEE